MQEDVVTRHHKTGAVMTRMGTESATVVPANVYPTRDGGFVALSGAGDQPFARLCEAIEVPDAVKDPRFSTSAARLANRAAADELVRAWVVKHDLADVEARFTKAGVAGTAVRSVDEIIADAHVRARRSALPLTSSSGRDFLAAAPTPRFSRTSARDAVAAPRLGEHTETVRASVERLAARPRPHVRSSSAPGAGALDGVRVLDLSQWLAGPAAAALLGDFGAEVVMVELPPTGASPMDGPGSRGVGFPVTNRNKRSITLDVRAALGREVFLELVRLSDVIIENFRPGTLERWNLGPSRAPRGQSPARAAAVVGIRADRAGRGAGGLQPGRPGLRRHDLSQRLSGSAAVPGRRHGRRLLDRPLQRARGGRGTSPAAILTAEDRWSTPPCSSAPCVSPAIFWRRAARWASGASAPPRLTALSE